MRRTFISKKKNMNKLFEVNATAHFSIVTVTSNLFKKEINNKQINKNMFKNAKKSNRSDQSSYSTYIEGRSKQGKG